MVVRTAEYWIDQLALRAHPEGGYFREIYRASEEIPAEGLPKRYRGPRAFGTSIYYLLRSGEISALHRLKSDELWHFYSGSPVALSVISPQGILTKTILGEDTAAGKLFQTVIPAGNWFGAVVMLPESYVLVGCTVVPGFDFADFEMGDRKKLLAKFPRHRDTIQQLTL